MNLEKIIYCLYCPDKKTPVYIGKSTRGLDRPWQHIASKSHSKKVNDWVNSLEEIGKQPVIVILDNAKDDDILTGKELFWIQRFLSKGELLLNVRGITPSFFLDKIYDEDDPLINIRMYIVNRRKQVGLTQVELARKAGVGLSVLRDLEQGRKTNFNTDTLDILLRMFGSRLTVE